MFFNVWLPGVSEAAVATKVISEVAKKTAKEAAKDIAIDMSFNMVMNYKYTPKDQRKPKEGFEMICLPKDKKTDGECTAPLQVKKNITRAELEPAVERQLEKKIAGGITATRWGKFLDWFIPIYATGIAVAIFDYAIDGDVMKFFDEVAYDSLVEMEFIDKTVGVAAPGLGGFVRPNVTLPPETDMPLAAMSWPFINLGTTENIDSLFDCVGVRDCIDFEVGFYDYSDRTLRVLPKYDGELQVTINGVTHRSKDFGVTPSGNTVILRQFATTKGGLDKRNLETYRYDTLSGMPMDASSYLGAYTSTGGGKGTLVNPEVAMKGYLNLLVFTIETLEIFGVKKEPLKFTYVPGPYVPDPEPIPSETVVPKFDETQLQPTKTPGSAIPLVAPGAYPTTETTTGTPVYPYRDANGNVEYRTEDGRIVDGEGITVGNPTITENPDGSTTVQKSPTPEDPNPKPGEIPGEEFPEGETCTESFKKPNFKPVSEAFTTSFPFSIPWDLKRIFDSLYSEIGNEAPDFKYEVNFMGKTHDFGVDIPKYFDKWTVFTKSLLLIIFDIGLIYAIYRFTKGGAE